MAVTKLWSVTERLGQVIDYATNPEKTSANIKREFSPEQYQALADVIAYAKDEEKTEREFYVEGINCNVAIARDQFITVKEQYQKTDGIQAYHGYLSFKETDISPEMAQKIGMEFANEVWGKRFQVVVTTHLNTKHLHCHFVINSISFVDGKHLWGEEKAWFKFRKVADRICEKYGLYYDPNPNRSKQSDYLTMKEKAGMPTRYSVAKEAIDYAIDHSKTLKEFQFALKEMGYAYNLSPSRKYWTVIPKGYDKPIRLKNLGADYTNDRIVERIKENRDRWAEIEPFQRATYKPRQYRMQTRGQKLKKKGGLYGLYLYYCYRLGYLPKYKKQNNARLHYLLKDDLMKLDKITDEVRLLGRENISTDEQLFSYKTSLEEQMKNLIAGRTHLRKKIRTNIDDGQLQAAKDEIASINGELKKLRREVKLCEDIAERSKVMEENLEHIELLLVSVLKQEQKTKGKARLTNMIKSGKELKVFSIPQKDLKKFTEQAKRYGVLYCVLRDKNTKGENAPVDIIARAEDASKIQRIVERFELGKVDKASIVSEAEKAIADREAVEKENPTKSKSEIIMEEAVRNPMQKEERANANPSVAKTDKSPLSRQNSEPVETQSDKGVAKPVEKPSVKEKLDRYKAQAKQQKEAERKEPEVKKDGKKPQQKNGQTVHRQPKKKPKTKER